MFILPSGSVGSTDEKTESTTETDRQQPFVNLSNTETQRRILRLKSDLVELCLKACDGKLDEVTSQWDQQASLGIVLAAEEYLKVSQRR